MKTLLQKKNVIITFKGTKKVKGKDTGKPCLVVGVSKKEDLQNLSEEDRIPKQTEEGQLTDVIVFSKVKALTSCPNNTEGSCYPHGIKHRPLQGGISIGASHLVNAGTLSLFVVDEEDEQIVLLTCNHVLGVIYNTVFPPETGVGYSNISYAECVQPGVYDGGHPIYDIIATGKRTIPISFGDLGSNYIDAAICTLNAQNLHLPGILDVASPASFPHASKLQYSVDNIVYKSGRTTGNTEATIIDKKASANVDYSGSIARFYDQILLYSPTRFLSAGDSGAPILFKSGGQYYLVGIIFAGSEDGLYGFANHISDIQVFLNIKSWDGSIGVAKSESEFIKIDGVCYHNNFTESLRRVSAVKQSVHLSCVDCLATSRKKLLFGNVL
jgi:hypothetical protein